MKLTEKEVWRPVKDYEGLYEVSNFGRVRSCGRMILKSNGVVQNRKSKIRKQVPTRTGYLQVNLSKNNIQKMVTFHKLVAQAFLPNPKGYSEINHKNEDKSDNRARNLEWCSRVYNNSYGTIISRIVAKNKNGALSKPIFQVTFSGKIVNFWPLAKEAGRYGFDFSKVAMCARGERSQHKGFQWMYCSQCK
jgi:hypothetical protein